MAYFKQQTDIVGYYFCTMCLLIALMDIDSYEVDLRILLGLTMVGLCNHTRCGKGAILSMVAGLILYITVYGVGKWIWQEEVFGMGDVYF